MDAKQPARPESAQWYYLREGEARGPITASSLRQLVASGRLPTDALVWREGMHQWLPAGELGLVAAPATPPPPPAPPPVASATSSVSRTRRDEGPRRRRATRARLWAWTIAAALGLLAAGVVVAHLVRSSGPRYQTAAAPERKEQRASASIRMPEDQRGRSPSDSPERTPGTASRVPGAAHADTPRPSRESVSKDDEILSPAEPAADNLDVPSAPDNAAYREPHSASPARGGPPRVLFQEIVIHKRPTFGVMGALMSQDIQFAILARIQRQPPFDDGSFRVVQDVLDTRLDRVDDMSRATYTKTLKELIGSKHTYTLNADCEVTRFDGYESGLTTLPVDMAGGSGLQMSQALDKDGWKEVIERSLLEPARHIAPGQSWTRQMSHDFSPLGRWAGITTFTQDTSTDSPLPRYRYTHDMTFTPSSSDTGSLPLKISDAKFELISATGTFVYDPKAMHVTQVSESFHVKGQIASELLGTLGSVELDERQQWTIRLSAQNPWEQK